MAHNCRHLKREGLAVVETAIVLPLLLLLVFAMIEYGWLFTKIQQTTNVARQAARVAMRRGSTDAEVVTAITTLMDNADLAGSGYAYEMPANIAGMARGETFRIEITVPYENIMLTGLPLPVPETIRASVTMAKE